VTKEKTRREENKTLEHESEMRSRKRRRERERKKTSNVSRFFWQIFSIPPEEGQ